MPTTFEDTIDAAKMQAEQTLWLFDKLIKSSRTSDEIASVRAAVQTFTSEVDAMSVAAAAKHESLTRPA